MLCCPAAVLFSQDRGKQRGTDNSRVHSEKRCVFAEQTVLRLSTLGFGIGFVLIGAKSTDGTPLGFVSRDPPCIPIPEAVKQRDKH